MKGVWGGNISVDKIFENSEYKLLIFYEINVKGVRGGFLIYDNRII